MRWLTRKRLIVLIIVAALVLFSPWECAIGRLVYSVVDKEINANQAQEAIKRDCGVEIKVDAGEFEDFYYVSKQYERPDGSLLYITCGGTPWHCTCKDSPG